MYFDSHTHLNNEELWQNRSEYITNFYNLGGKWIVNIGVDITTSELAIQIAKENLIDDMNILATIWLHPNMISENNRTMSDIDEQVILLKKIHEDNSKYIYAIGEIGTDLHYDITENEHQLQKYMFAKQCQMASDLWLPIVIHSRDDRSGTLEVLLKFKNIKIYMHCWGYDTDNLQSLIDNFDVANIYIWFAGNLTYPKATNIHQSLVFAYQNNMNILTETDAPYLKPQAVRNLKEPNKSEYITYIYDYITQKLWIQLQDLQNVIETNFNKFYWLWS